MYTKVDLPYSFDALEPYIDAKTVEIHYTKHHTNYLNKLNEILGSLGYDYKYSLPELIKHIDEFPIEQRDAILFNAGGVLNHDLYWTIMSPNKNTTPVGALKAAIDNEFGGFDKFKEKFIEKTMKLVGSGWTFLVLTPNGDLDIINTSNQESPYLYGFVPIFGLDLWEHAYYLNYQNRRPEYVSNFFEIIDFTNINEIYEKAKKN